ncbi:MAG TPA: Gfo/Idh/MocA family oxidoreductase [Chitinophagaceae bacterium]|nr:Gfo/Idh/MocA family oxidoreductase [Chitinophagaceae bacterium]
MKRRSFIKNSSLLAGGFYISKSMSGMPLINFGEKINIAIIGCGDRGKGIISVMKDLKEYFNIVAICDVLPFRIEETKKYLSGEDYKIYSDYRKLLNDKNVHAVVNATPLYLHFKISSDIIKEGKHVYHEKTMTFNIEESLSFIKLVESRPAQVFQVGHQYRSVPLYARVKEMIEKDYLGKVTQIDCRWDRNSSWRRAVPDPSLERQINWRMYKAYSGGLVAELLSHQIDFINWAFKSTPQTIIGTGGIDFYKDGRETFDNVQVVLRYKEGMIGNFGATCSNSHEGYIFRIKGTKGAVELKVNDGFYYPEPKTKKELETVDGVTGATKIEWTKEGGIPILKEKSAKDGTWYALKEFYDCIQNKKLPSSNVYTGAKTAIIVKLANDSMYQNKIYDWKPEYNIVKKV